MLSLKIIKYQNFNKVLNTKLINMANFKNTKQDQQYIIINKNSIIYQLKL